MKLKQTLSARVRGFTLIELLAVAAVVIALACLRLPALAKTKPHGELYVCQNNARQLALAALVYSEDFNGKWVGNGRGTDTLVDVLNPPAGFVEKYWSEGREQDVLTDENRANALASPKFCLLAPYLKSTGSYHCPSDKPVVIANRTFFRVRNFGMNLFFGWNDLATFANEPSAAFKVFRKVSEVPRPAAFFLYGEIHPYSICRPAFGTHPGGGSLMSHYPANYHGRITTFSFADGHAEGHKWASEFMNNPSLPNNFADPVWHDHASAHPDKNKPQVLNDIAWLNEHATELK